MLKGQLGKNLSLCALAKVWKDRKGWMRCSRERFVEKGPRAMKRERAKEREYRGSAYIVGLETLFVGEGGGGGRGAGNYGHCRLFNRGDSHLFTAKPDFSRRYTV